MQGISEYLTGKTIFLTGATGFLGQPLVEKILFAAPEVGRIYALIRPTKRMSGSVVSARQRLERELYASSAFDRLRGIHGDKLQLFLRTKLLAVTGDLSLENLGIAAEDLARLKEEADLVINCAAVVSFDAPLDEALSMNVVAAGRVAEFAASCRSAVLVHVSTAYVNGATHKEPAETTYHRAPEGTTEPFPPGYFTDADRDIEHVKSIIEGVYEETTTPARQREFTLALLKQAQRKKRKRPRRKDRLERFRREWTQDQLTRGGMLWARQRGWNDTYTYSKALGEQLVLAHRKEVPTVILRPSIIESSLSEPCPGWLDGLRMADPLIAAVGKGRLKSLPLDPDVLLDLVPVDVVVNALLASLPGVARDGGVQVYQVATSSKNPITLGELYDLIFNYFKKYPMLDKKGRPILIRRLRFPNPATFRLQHRLRSVQLYTAERTLERLSVFETTKKVRRRISAARLTNQKLYYYGEIYEPYLNLDCQFRVERTAALFESLRPEEKKRFNFDVTRINWRHYIQNVHIPGVKKFILKIEGAGTMELDAAASKLPVATINELVDKSSEEHGPRVALQIEKDGNWVRHSYADLRNFSLEIGARLRGHGLRKGDRVVLFSENQPEWGLAYLGAVRNGLTVVPIDAQTWYREAWSIAAFTDARAILASQKCFSRLTEERLADNEANGTPVLLLNVNEHCRAFGRSDLPRSCPEGEPNQENVDFPEVHPDDPASIIFTTGTMVDPRGAVHTHRNFLANLFGVNKNLPVQPDDVFLSVLPLYHALEFTCGFLMPISGGAKITYATTLKPRVILETMRRTGTTCMLGVPTLYALLRDYLERKVLRASHSTFRSNLMVTSKQISRSVERRFGHNIGRKLFSKVHQEFGGGVRVFVSGGSTLGEDLFEDFKAMGMPIYEGYGLTETAPVLTVNPLNRARVRSAGRPLPGVEVRLDHPDKHGVGEIVVRSPSLMTGYFRNNAADRAVMEDDWFHTGDLGWVDIDGYIYLTGRIKDVIVTGAGKNVYPVDLEAIYCDIPGVGEIGVVGIPKGLTEEIHAVIRAEPQGSQTRSTTEAAIQKEIRRLARELPSYHRLQQVHFWPEALPATESGEFDRAALRRLLLRQLKESRERDIRPRGEGTTVSSPERLLIAELSRISGVPESGIHRATDLYADLGLDSLQAIELLLFAEEGLGVSIPDDEAVQLSKVGELFDAARTLGETEAREEERGMGGLPSSTLSLNEKRVLDRALLRCSFGTAQVVLHSWFGLHVTNGEAVPIGQPYILAANHSSHLDTGAVVAALAHSKGLDEALRLHVLGARDYFFASRWRGWLVSKLLNVVPIERHENSLASLKLVKGILSSGEPILIYPEGTRSRTGDLQGFKAGLGLIAWEMQIPVVPIAIAGTHAALPAGRSWPSRHPVQVIFGDPVGMEQYHVQPEESSGDELYRRIARDVQARVRGLQAVAANG